MRSKAGDSALMLRRLGAEGGLIASIDDVFRNPAAVLAAAAAARFAVDSPFYPGVRAAITHAIRAEVERATWPILAEHFGCSRQMTMQNASFALTATLPDRLRPAQRIPHFDGVDEGQFAALIHLARRDLGGTGFFRHRSTGYERITAERQQHYFSALRDDLNRVGRPAPAYINGSTDIYELIGMSPAIFNRMVVYRGNMLHSALVCGPAALDGSPEKGRLTITCFLTAR